MRELELDGVARKDERLSVPFDSETYEWLEKMAAEEERPTARQVTLYVKAVKELIEEQGFQLVQGKLRRVTVNTEEEVEP